MVIALKCTECNDPTINTVACNCSSLFIGDHSIGPVTIPVGNAWIDANCNLVGSIVLPSSGTVVVEVTGTSCQTSGGTRWELEICCGDNQNGVSCVSTIPLNSEIIESECVASVQSSVQSSVTHNSANITYATSGCVQSVIVEYRPIGNPSWSSEVSSNSPVQINNLIAGTAYEYRLIVICCNGSTSTAQGQSFYTESCFSWIDVQNDASLGYITPGLYEYDDFVKSNDISKVGTFVTFHGGDYVELYGGFCAELGTNFIADIQDCNPSTQPLTSDGTQLIQENSLVLSLKTQSVVNVELIDNQYNVISQLLTNKTMEVGEHKVILSDIERSGVYLLKIEIDKEIKLQRVFIVKN